MMETKSWKRPIIAQNDAQSRRIKSLMILLLMVNVSTVQNVSTSHNAFHLPP